MLDHVLASRIDNPYDSNDSNRQSQEEAKVIDIVRRLVEFNGLDQ
jgi:hypothetical protein